MARKTYTVTNRHGVVLYQGQRIGLAINALLNQHSKSVWDIIGPKIRNNPSYYPVATYAYIGYVLSANRYCYSGRRRTATYNDRTWRARAIYDIYVVCLQNADQFHKATVTIS